MDALPVGGGRGYFRGLDHSSQADRSKNVWTSSKLRAIDDDCDLLEDLGQNSAQDSLVESIAYGRLASVARSYSDCNRLNPSLLLQRPSRTLQSRSWRYPDTCIIWTKKLNAA
jgi:hypothetical protein